MTTDNNIYIRESQILKQKISEIEIICFEKDNEIDKLKSENQNLFIETENLKNSLSKLKLLELNFKKGLLNIKVPLKIAILGFQILHFHV